MKQYFQKGRAEFRRRDYDIDTHTEIVVSPEDDIELRRVQLTNRTRHAEIIDITSYAEVVLASAAADLSIRHSVISLFRQKLFTSGRQFSAPGGPGQLMKIAMDVSPDGSSWGRNQEVLPMKQTACNSLDGETLLSLHMQ